MLFSGQHLVRHPPTTMKTMCSLFHRSYLLMSQHKAALACLRDKLGSLRCLQSKHFHNSLASTHGSLPRDPDPVEEAVPEEEGTILAHKATHPAGRASGAWAAAGSCCVPEVLGSSPSAGVDGAGRDVVLGFGDTLKAVAGGAVTPTAEGSSGSLAVVGSSFAEMHKAYVKVTRNKNFVFFY